MVGNVAIAQSGELEATLDICVWSGMDVWIGGGFLLTIREYMNEDTPAAIRPVIQ